LFDVFSELAVSDFYPRHILRAKNQPADSEGFCRENHSVTNSLTIPPGDVPCLSEIREICLTIYKSSRRTLFIGRK